MSPNVQKKCAKIFVVSILAITSFFAPIFFQKALGSDFDPLEKALEFENLDSAFWKKVLSNDFLSGLLYGFGERNSLFFSATRKEKDKKIKFIFPSEFSSKSDGDILFHESTLEKLSIPPFVSFDLPYGKDPIVTKFKKEREIIQASLKNKDLLDEALKKILGKKSLVSRNH